MISLMACRALPPARPDGVAEREVDSGYGVDAGRPATRAGWFFFCGVGYAPHRCAVIGADRKKVTIG